MSTTQTTTTTVMVTTQPTAPSMNSHQSNASPLPLPKPSSSHNATSPDGGSTCSSSGSSTTHKGHNFIPKKAILGHKSSSYNLGKLPPPRKSLLTQCIYLLSNLFATVVTLMASVMLLFALSHAAHVLEDASTYLAVVCPVTSFLLFFSPFGVVKTAISKNSAEALPVKLFVVQSLANLLAIDYGLKVQNLPVVVTNTIGVLLQVTWLSSHHYITRRNSRWHRFALSIALGVGVVFYMCSFADERIVGVGVFVANFMLFGTPVLQLGEVLATRKSDGIPFAISLAMVITNACWSVYGLLVEDVVLWLPSVLGYLLSVFQLLIIAWCHSYLPFDITFLALVFPSPKDTSGDKTPKQVLVKALPPATMLKRFAEHERDQVNEP
ncbi:unnamed protein product [Vitrella brassicaformis CCMP3155]|uniref:Bidirectional sugar transporter SWEET n=2 Tax=Vitrella brassicaformis TaxID=1169539 RepID=A0A0G4FA77_VITBC|nr:unnamed protein product [Vitrella brassicaformis CCMP3155]|mmetsp:Transcript_50119/g.125655  ORF Transcript_50119/g.125655 Transcript_50119/m.125655 type:complete len:381 (+) Transcript_50119:62-1204(+)|eukprot:CEM09786.1 unnamed protein product [Vitrella brassicaformis CCMP3155]